MRLEDNAEEQEQSELLSLPNELLEHIIFYLDYQSVARLGSTNTRLHIATQQRRLADKAVNLKFKKWYLKTFALYGTRLKNFGLFSQITDLHSPVDWIKCYSALCEKIRSPAFKRIDYWGRDMENMRWIELEAPNREGILLALECNRTQVARLSWSSNEETSDNPLTSLDQIKKRFLEYLFIHPAELEKPYIKALVEGVFSYRDMRLKQDWDEPLRTGELGTLYEELGQYYALPKMNLLARAYRSLQYRCQRLPYTEYPPFELAILLYSPFILIIDLYFRVCIIDPYFQKLIFLFDRQDKYPNFRLLLFLHIAFLAVWGVVNGSFSALLFMTGLLCITGLAVLITGLALALAFELGCGVSKVGKTVSQWFSTNTGLFSSRFLACLPTSSALEYGGLG